MELIAGGKLLVIVGICFVFSKEFRKITNMADGYIHNVNSHM